MKQLRINLGIFEILEDVENVVERRRGIGLDKFELSGREFMRLFRLSKDWPW